MTLELYTISGSPYAWRVQLALEHKQIPFELRTLSMSAGDVRAPAFLALNPRGRVPVLVDGDYVLNESLAILAYIEARWPTPALFGATPAQTGRIWRVIAECTAYLDAPVEDFTVPIYFNRPSDKLDSAAKAIADELSPLAAQLERTPWLAGDQLTAADFVVLPHVQSILRAASKPAASTLALPFLPLAPTLADWRARIEALPYYARTVPAHWR
ncbi:MAG TPA: glutathione S-transferase family protein [Kofleriaceae bacterium]